MPPQENTKSKVLVVEDEPDAIELISFNLKNAGFEVTTATDGQEALETARKIEPDIILLDLMLPEVDGLEVCKILRRNAKTADIPIVMLTAKAAEIDRVLGLELGADDYITKPFSPREVVLRLKNVLGRRQPAPANQDELRVEGIVINIPRHEVSVDGEVIELTATEFRLLTLLMERRGRVQSREKLLQDVWGYESNVDTRTVDTHMRRLRDKLKGASKYLDTVRGVGYRFRER